MTWLDDVAESLMDLGGEASLAEIYPVVYGKRLNRGEPLGKYESWIRYNLQQHSRGKGRDIFLHTGRGKWALRSNHSASKT